MLTLASWWRQEHLREEMESKNRAARESYVARRNGTARESSEMSLSADDFIVRSLAYREGLAVELQAALYKWHQSKATAPASTLSLHAGPPDESDEEYVPYEEYVRTKSFATMAATMLKRANEEYASQQMQYASQKPMGPDNEVETSGTSDAKRCCTDPSLLADDPPYPPNDAQDQDQLDDMNLSPDKAGLASAPKGFDSSRIFLAWQAPSHLAPTR